MPLKIDNNYCIAIHRLLCYTIEGKAKKMAISHEEYLRIMAQREYVIEESKKSVHFGRCANADQEAQALTDLRKSLKSHPMFLCMQSTP